MVQLLTAVINYRISIRFVQELLSILGAALILATTSALGADLMKSPGLSKYYHVYIFPFPHMFETKVGTMCYFSPDLSLIVQFSQIVIREISHKEIRYLFFFLFSITIVYKLLMHSKFLQTVSKEWIINRGAICSYL